MRKNIVLIGVGIFVVGFVLGFLSGANPPKIPGIYGSNQVMWLALAIAGIVVVIVGLILKKESSSR